VVDQELKLWEREEQDVLRLEHDLEALVSRKSDLSSREATLAIMRKGLEETYARVLASVLTADIRNMHLNTREEELADRKKGLAEREKQLVEKAG
jgi:hypothetical protein